MFQISLGTSNCFLVKDRWVWTEFSVLKIKNNATCRNTAWTAQKIVALWLVSDYLLVSVSYARNNGFERKQKNQWKISTERADESVKSYIRERLTEAAHYVMVFRQKIAYLCRMGMLWHIFSMHLFLGCVPMGPRRKHGCNKKCEGQDQRGLLKLKW